jgi:hypothetical protein
MARLTALDTANWIAATALHLLSAWGAKAPVDRRLSVNFAERGAEAAPVAKKQLTQGLDPAAVKRDRKIAEAADTDTFKRIAEEYLDKLRGEGRARTTMKKVE